MVGLLYSNHVDDKATTMCVKPSMPNKSTGCVSGPSTCHITTNTNPSAIYNKRVIEDLVNPVKTL